jgi:hypothetical protein
MLWKPAINTMALSQLFFFFLLPQVLAQGLTSVANSQGIIEGVRCANSRATRFLGVPYAQPPIGNLRFKAPQAYTAPYNGGSFVATTPGASCIQFGPLLFTESGPTSEDWYGYFERMRRHH